MKYGELRKVGAVKKSFAIHFFKNIPRRVPNYKAFSRLIDRFKSSSGHTRPQAPPGRQPLPREDITAVKQFFRTRKNKNAHLAEASRSIGSSIGKIWFILRKILKWKAYKPAASTVLSIQQQAVRLD